MSDERLLAFGRHPVERVELAVAGGTSSTSLFALADAAGAVAIWRA